MRGSPRVSGCRGTWEGCLIKSMLMRAKGPEVPTHSGIKELSVKMSPRLTKKRAGEHGEGSSGTGPAGMRRPRFDS